MREKRKSKRFRINNIFVTAFSTTEFNFKVIDISEGGIAFYSKNDFEIGRFLDICTTLSDICLGTEIVNIIKIPLTETDSEYPFRVGCKFQPWVSSRRISQLIERFQSDE